MNDPYTTKTSKSSNKIMIDHAISVFYRLTKHIETSIQFCAFFRSFRKRGLMYLEPLYERDGYRDIS